jgi:hypothetical protein
MVLTFSGGVDGAAVHTPARCPRSFAVCPGAVFDGPPTDANARPRKRPRKVPPFAPLSAALLTLWLWLACLWRVCGARWPAPAAGCGRGQDPGPGSGGAVVLTWCGCWWPRPARWCDPVRPGALRQRWPGGLLACCDTFACPGGLDTHAPARDIIASTPDRGRCFKTPLKQAVQRPR